MSESTSSGGVTTADLAWSVSEVASAGGCSMNFLAAAAMTAIWSALAVDEADEAVVVVAATIALSLPFSSYLQWSKICWPSSSPAALHQHGCMPTTHPLTLPFSSRGTTN